MDDPGPPLLLRERLVGIALAGTSGAAILAHVFGGLRMSFTVPFVVLPTTLLLGGMTLLYARRPVALHAFSRLVLAGGAWGLLATSAYDVVRPVLKLIFRFDFNPYRAIPIFGQLMTGLPPSEPAAQLAGWTYHFWNGISFGIVFALLRPRGGVLWGWGWAMLLQGLMMAAYPRFLAVRLADPGFLAAGIVGHSLWGVVLGLGLRPRVAKGEELNRSRRAPA